MDMILSMLKIQIDLKELASPRLVTSANANVWSVDKRMNFFLDSQKINNHNDKKPSYQVRQHSDEKVPHLTPENPGAGGPSRTASSSQFTRSSVVSHNFDLDIAAHRPRQRSAPKGQFYLLTDATPRLLVRGYHVRCVSTHVDQCESTWPDQETCRQCLCRDLNREKYVRVSFMHIIVVEHVVRYNLIIIVLFCFLFFPRLDYLLGDDQIKPLLILEGTHWKFQDCPDRHCYGKRKLNEKEGKEEKRRKNRINKVHSPQKISFLSASYYGRNGFPS